MFAIFKQENATACPMIKTFMVDKCVNEIVVLEHVFPSIMVELCHSHCLDAFQGKFSSLQCLGKVIDDLPVLVLK